MESPVSRKLISATGWNRTIKIFIVKVYCFSMIPQNIDYLTFPFDSLDAVECYNGVRVRSQSNVIRQKRLENAIWRKLYQLIKHIPVLVAANLQRVSSAWQEESDQNYVLNPFETELWLFGPYSKSKLNLTEDDTISSESPLHKSNSTHAFPISPSHSCPGWLISSSQVRLIIFSSRLLVPQNTPRLIDFQEFLKGFFTIWVEIRVVHFRKAIVRGFDLLLLSSW